MSKRRGMDLLEVLQVIFIVLRCLGLIDWTLVQVFAPILIKYLFIVICRIIAWIDWMWG